MSALGTKSKFYYGHTVILDNQYLDFSESAVLKVAAVQIGSYSLTAFLLAVQVAINQALNTTCTVSVDRVSRIVTIDFVDPIDALALTGNNVGRSLWTLLGIDNVDYLATTQIVGTLPSGFSFSPQFFLQDYTHPRDSLKAASATVSKSASGRVSVQSFGQESFMKCNIRFNTNITQQPNFIVENNPTGVDEIRAFLTYLITKAPVEFMENRNDPETYIRLLLESTSAVGDGTGFELQERYDLGLPFYFDTGKLTFRLVEDL